MYNPLCLLNADLLDAMTKSGKKYFVRQAYPRGISPDHKPGTRSFLISHYENRNHASQHLEALISDPSKHLYDWNKAEDRVRLKIAASQPDGFVIFAPVVLPDWKEKAEHLLKPKMMRYVDSQLHWFPSRKDTLDFDLYPQNGEVFVTLKWKNNRVKVPLSTIEEQPNSLLTLKFTLGT